MSSTKIINKNRPKNTTLGNTTGNINPLGKRSPYTYSLCPIRQKVLNPFKQFIKVGVAYVNVCISRRLKEELVWVIDNKMLFKTVVLLRN